MTREVNIFNLGKQPRVVEDQTFEVNLIENLTSEHWEELELETECDFELESDDFNLDQVVESAVNWASNPISPNVEPTNFSSEAITLVLMMINSCSYSLLIILYLNSFSD